VSIIGTALIPSTCLPFLRSESQPSEQQRFLAA
jgi:hypothetical protein